MNQAEITLKQVRAAMRRAGIDSATELAKRLGDTATSPLNRWQRKLSARPSQDLTLRDVRRVCEATKHELRLVPVGTVDREVYRKLLEAAAAVGWIIPEDAKP